MAIHGRLHVLGLDLSGRLATRNAVEHALHQLVIVLVAVGLEVEVGGHLGEPLVADMLDVLLHEGVVVAPADAGGADGGLLGAGRDLVCVQIVQVELIDQGLLDLLVQDEVAVGVHLAPRILKGGGHVAVDVDRLAVPAVAGEIGNVVLAVESLDPAHHRIEGTVEHQARNVPFRAFQLLVRRVGVAEMERHRRTSSRVHR